MIPVDGFDLDLLQCHYQGVFLFNDLTCFRHCELTNVPKNKLQKLLQSDFKQETQLRQMRVNQDIVVLQNIQKNLRYMGMSRMLS